MPGRIAVSLVLCFVGCIIVLEGVGLPRAAAQVLDQQIVSVTRFDSCLQSPLANAAVQNVTGVDPNEQLDQTPPTTNGCGPDGESTSVIALGLRIQPRAIQGGQTFDFTIGGLGTSDVSTTADQDVPVCQGVREGQDCSVLSNEIRISIASTELFAAYDLTPVRDIPYAYANRFAVINDDDDLNDILCSGGQCDKNADYNVPQLGQSYVVSRECSNVESLSDVFDLSAATSNVFEDVQGQTRVETCPTTPPSGSVRDPTYYYIPRDDSPLIPDSGRCDLGVFGPTANENDGEGYVAEVLQFGPLCKVFNVDPRAKAAMHLEVSVQTGGSAQSIRIGTEQYGAIKGIPGVVSAQINGVNTPTGLVGPYLAGQYVVCNSCDDAGDTTCVPGFIDDLAGGPAIPAPTGGIKTLYNPYRDYELSLLQTDENKRCPIPSQRCRQQFRGKPDNAFAYFVPDHRVVENAEICNSNGVGANLYEDPDIRRYIGAALATCPVDNNKGTKNPNVCFAFNACLPGYEQPIPNPQSVFNRNFVPTPCTVSQSFGESLASADPQSTTNSFSHVELDRNFINPNYFYRNERVYRDAYGGSTTSLSMTLYVVADDLVSVVNIAPGKFSSGGLSCGGTNGGSGSIGFRVLNTGNSVGTYVVDIGFFLPPSETASLTVTTNAVPSVDKNGTLAAADLVVRVSQLTAAPREFVDAVVEYEYAGNLGSEVVARLVLRAETASNTQRLDELVVTCVNIQGVNEFTALLNEDDPFNDPDAGLQCYWWKFYGGCLKTFGIVELLIYLLLFFLVGIFIVTSCCFVCNYWEAISKSRRAVKIAKQGVSIRTTQYTSM